MFAKWKNKKKYYTKQSKRNAIQNTPEEVENAAQFISTARPTVHTNPSRKPNFSKLKRSSNRRDLKTPA